MVEEHVLSSKDRTRFLIGTCLVAGAVACLLSKAKGAESWYTAMTPLDTRAPLPKPSEPDADTDNSGPFHAPAPAVVKASAKKPAAKPKAPAPKAEAPKPGCKCEPCECGKAAPQAKALDPAFDPRLKRMPSGYWYGTTVSGQTYYSAEPADVLRMLDSANAYYAQPAAPYCTTGTCYR